MKFRYEGPFTMSLKSYHERIDGGLNDLYLYLKQKHLSARKPARHTYSEHTLLCRHTFLRKYPRIYVHKAVCVSCYERQSVRKALDAGY